MLRLIASPPLGYLGAKPAHLLRQMLTVQTFIYLPSIHGIAAEFTGETSQEHIAALT